MVLHLQVPNQTQLAVYESVNQFVCFPTLHAFTPLVLGPESSCCSLERARANRDMTVPTGIEAISAISLYDMPSISRKMTTSRNSGGNASMAFLTSSLCAAASNIDSGFPGAGSIWWISSSNSVVKSLKRFCRNHVKQVLRTIVNSQGRLCSPRNPLK